MGLNIIFKLIIKAKFSGVSVREVPSFISKISQQLKYD